MLTISPSNIVITLRLPFYQGKADFGNHYTKTRYWCSEPTKVAPENSILFSVRAPVGDINLTQNKCCIGRGLSAIIGKSVEQPYLYQMLQFVKPKFQLISQGSTFEAVNGSDLKEFKLLTPPLPEQKKIAEILSSVDDVIETTETQINKLKDLKKGMMNELLTKGIGHTEFKDSLVGKIPVEWEVKKTGEIAKSIVPGRNKPKAFNGNIPWITISDIGSLFITKSKIGLGVSRDALSDAQGKTIPPNSVIMTVVGDFGISGVAKNEMVINQQLHAFVCGNKVLPLYLCFVIRLLKKKIENLSTQTTISYLNKDNSESILIPIPPLQEQQKIASILSSIDTNIEERQTKLTQSKNLKKSLMADLLTGRVRVKVN